MADVVHATGDHTVIRSQWCETEVQRLSADVIVMTFRGVGEEEPARLLLPALDRMLGGQPVHVFADTWELQSYSPPFRKALTEFARTMLPRMRSLRVLVRSRVVAMGTSLSGAVLGGKLRAVTSRETFDAAIEAALASAED